MHPVVVENVTKTFRQGDRTISALASISLEVHQGQFLAIMGASGSGKSTLLHLMAGLARPDSGIIRVSGSDLAQMPDRQLTLFRRRNIGLIFQSFNLIPTLTAEENIALPLMLEHRNGRPAQEKVEQLLESLGIADRRSHRPDALSGGEQQRVAIGRALVADPAVVLADEPTGNLDSVNSRSICELLRDLSVLHNKTIVMVTHEPVVGVYAREVAVIRDGQIVNRFATDNQSAPDLAIKYSECLR
ncbi:MAG: ABC transporter ATP-binding protein [Tepidisphaeraceae bacterium]